MKGIIQQYQHETGSSDVGIRVSYSLLSEPFPMHGHDFYEYEFVMEGAGRHCLNGIWYDISEGDTWILSADDYHYLEPKNILRIGCISCSPPYLPDVLKNILEKQEYPMTGKLDAEALSHAEEYFSDFLSAGGKYKKEKKTAFAVLLFGTLLDHSRVCTSSSDVDTNLSYIHSAIRFIQKHYGENCSLKDTAQAANLSSGYLCTLFSRYTGCGFSEYLNRIRIAKAQELLTQTDLSIIEIASRSGFGCVSTMNRAFRRYLSEVPSEFRRKE